MSGSDLRYTHQFWLLSASLSKYLGSLMKFRDKIDRFVAKSGLCHILRAQFTVSHLTKYSKLFTIILILQLPTSVLSGSKWASVIANDFQIYFHHTCNCSIEPTHLFGTSEYVHDFWLWIWSKFQLNMKFKSVNFVWKNGQFLGQKSTLKKFARPIIQVYSSNVPQRS